MIRHCIHCTEGGLVNIRTYNNQLATFRLILCHGGSYIISQYKNESQKLGSDGTCRSLNDHMVIRPILFHVSLDYKMCAGLCNIPLLYIYYHCAYFNYPLGSYTKANTQKSPIKQIYCFKVQSLSKAVQSPSIYLPHQIHPSIYYVATYN